MTISGFTFVRNALLFDYPLYESISSLLPLCDELIIAAGKSDDGTIEFLKNLDNPKIKIIETIWDDNLKNAGLIYSDQTNVALNHCTGDWCIYLQADEVIHEDDLTLIRQEIENNRDNLNIDSLLFKYLHFYGSYDYIGMGRQWYRREIRAFRNTPDITSFGDAQGFRKQNGVKFEKLKAKQTDARIYHYGWVRPPKVQNQKINITNNYYHGAENTFDLSKAQDFDYDSAYDLNTFKGTHPKIMNSKIIKDKIWTKNFDPNKTKSKPFLVKVLDKIEFATGYRIGEFKDFIEIK